MATPTDVDSVLGVEDGALDKVEATPHRVTRGEGRPVRLPRPRRAEDAPVVGMVTVRMLLPACACEGYIGIPLIISEAL